MRGTQFLDAYTKGDNRLVVATDTMKNFIHAVSLRARARALEEWLLEVGTAFLDTYPHMERLTMLGRDLPFPAAVVPSADGFEMSDRLFSRDRCDYGTARLELARDASGTVEITDHESGHRELQLIKITGSAFADFARDEHTTLPERRDRPLYIWCDIGWTYTDASHAVLADPSKYVATEQVADLANAVFHEFVSLSIQHLVNEIGLRMLDRWPQLASVSRSTRRTGSGTSAPRPMTAARRRTRIRDRRSGTSAWSFAATDRRLRREPIIGGWSIAGHRSMTTSSPASAASCAASSFQTSSCIQTAFAPISIASATCGMTRSERRKRSTTSIGDGDGAQVGVRGLAVDGLLLRVDRHDVVALAQQVARHAVRRAPWPRRAADHRPDRELAQDPFGDLRVGPARVAGFLHSPTVVVPCAQVRSARNSWVTGGQAQRGAGEAPGGRP